MHKLIRLAAVITGSALLLVAVMVAQGPGSTEVRGAAIGGPVILGGDDLTDHGGVDIDGTPVLGWLYMQRSLENIKPDVTRSNDGSVAALGSSASASTCCDAGAAIGVAADKAGLTVTYYDGGAAIDGFFADLAAGDTDPAIIWIAGNGASNNLDSFDEVTALIDGASGISDFVNSGGGLMSHGTNYEWLQALIPGIITVDGGSEDDLYFTDDGLSDLPALTELDINAGPWHNHFEGDLGGLKVLVRSSSVLADCGDQEFEAAAVQACEDAPVIIGGAQVSITDPIEDDEPTATPTSCIPPLVNYRCDGRPNSGGSTNATATTVASTPVPVATVAGATVVPAATSTRVSQPLGVIIAPDTGDGTGTTGSGMPMSVLLAAGILGLTIVAAGARGIRHSR